MSASLPSALIYQSGLLNLLDQRLLPNHEQWVACRDIEDVAVAIESMVIRGAPAIAIAALFGLAIDTHCAVWEGILDWKTYAPRFQSNIARLKRTRPTAVNLFRELDNVVAKTASFGSDMQIRRVHDQVEAMSRELFDKDFGMCQAIGQYGADHLGKAGPLTIMTHCNTGSLATAGWGTALGVIRSLAERGKIAKVYVNETRPFLQGARLTCFELMKEKIPYSLQVDSAAAFIMAQKKIDAVIVGADRIAVNGDTANKVGTYQIAIAAQYHKVPFYVAAPTTSFDLKTPSGSHIEIEYRDQSEISTYNGKAIAPEGSEILNPSFDVTPNQLIAGFITELGVLRPPFKF